MVEQLAHLRDIHLPAPVSQWSLAPGYFILVLLLILILGAYFWTRQSRQIKREALRQLQQIDSRANKSEIALKISSLLKQVALAYYPREQVASLQGEAWLQFLNQTGKKLDFFSVKFELIELPFTQNPNTPASIQQLVTLSKRWIKQRGYRCSN